MGQHRSNNTALIIGGCALVLLCALCVVGGAMWLFARQGDSAVVPPGPARAAPGGPVSGQDVLVGCWNAGPQDPGVECYGPTGRYTIDNGRTGVRSGTWTRIDPTHIEVTLERSVRWEATPDPSSMRVTFRNTDGTYVFQRTARGVTPM